MNALPRLEVVSPADVDQEEPRSVSTEGQGGHVPGEGEDLGCFFVVGWVLRSSGGHSSIV